MKSVSEFGILLAVAGLAAGGNWLADGRPSGMPPTMSEVPVREGSVILEDVLRDGLEGVVWVDARRESEWRADGMAGSIHITTLSDTDLAEQIAGHGDVLFAARRVVIYCGDVNCGLSHELAVRMKEYLAGVEVVVLHGGMEALRAGGLIKSPSPGP